MNDFLSRMRGLAVALCWSMGLLAALLSGHARADVGQIDIIVNRDVDISRINAAGLRNIYLLRTTQWQGGAPLTAFVLPDNNPTHETFAKEVLGLYPYRLRQTWDRLSFSGMARPPIEVRDENDMRARVRSTPGAIGYITKDTGNESIKILRLE